MAPRAWHRFPSGAWSDPWLTPGDLRTLAALWEHADPTGGDGMAASVSVRAIARHVGRSPGTVADHLSALRDAGWIGPATGAAAGRAATWTLWTTPEPRGPESARPERPRSARRRADPESARSRRSTDLSTSLPDDAPPATARDYYADDDEGTTPMHTPHPHPCYCPPCLAALEAGAYRPDVAPTGPPRPGSLAERAERIAARHADRPALVIVPPARARPGPPAAADAR